jgi:cysteinyl-tRNA synthetase
MHAGAVRVDGEKMSKSLGNFFTIREILAEYHPEVVRYLLISSHYRSAINYSLETLQTARGALQRLYTSLRGIAPVASPGLQDLDDEDRSVQRFLAAMDDDFNTPLALSVLFELVRELNLARSEGDEAESLKLARTLKGLGSVLGLLQQDPELFLKAGGADALGDDDIEALVAEREQAKRDKDYARADAIRNRLKQQGVALEDSREGTLWKRS